MPLPWFKSLVALALLVLVGSAQTPLISSNVVGSGALRRHLVKDSNGTLWALSLAEVGTTRPLTLLVSGDSGVTWGSVPFAFNSAASGLNMPNGTNACALAVDSSGRLHAIWGSYWYPSYFRQHYRWFDPNSGLSSPEIDLSAAVGAAVTSRTDAMAIEVDANDSLWIAAHGPASWSSVLLFSAGPVGPTPTFTNFGTLSASASSQAPSLAVDAAGDVHAAYYRNTSNGILEHRKWMTQLGAFGPATTLGNSTAPQDYLCQLAADSLGFVHAAYYVDTVAPSNWVLEYRKWDPVTGFAAAEVLDTATQASYTTNAYATFAIAAEAAAGAAHVVFRDFAGGGHLRHLRKSLYDTSWIEMPLASPSLAGINEIYVPTLRGSLYPNSNTVLDRLDLTYRINVAAPFSLAYSGIAAYPDLLVSLAALPSLGATTPIVVYGPGESLAPFVLAFALSNANPILLSDGRVIPLDYDFVFQLSLDPANPFFQMNAGFLSATGLAVAGVTLPSVPALSGLNLFAAAATGSPMASLGISRISPSLRITFP